MSVHVASDSVTLEMIVLVFVGITQVQLNCRKIVLPPVCCPERGMRMMSLLHADYRPRLPA